MRARRTYTPAAVAAGADGDDTARPRLDSLTGLRFLAALLVFSHHAGSAQWSATLGPLDRLTAAGGQGVSFFFLLSGFVLMWSRRPGDTAWSFYRRRAARVLPNWAVVWPLAILVAVWEGYVPPAGVTVPNLTLTQAWVPDMSVYFGLNSVTWSLSVEVFFYLVFPLLIPALLRLRSAPRRALMLALVLAVTAFNAVGSYFVDLSRGDDVLLWLEWICPLTRLPEFVLGALLAAELAQARGRRPVVGVAGALAAVLVSLLAMSVLGGPFFGQWPTLVPFGLLIAACAARDASGRGTVFSSRALVRLGEWSFAFYLVHQLVIRVIHGAGFVPVTELRSVAFVALALAVSLALSALLYALVERPAERRLRGSRRPRAQVEALAEPARA